MQAPASDASCWTSRIVGLALAAAVGCADSATLHQDAAFDAGQDPTSNMDAGEPRREHDASILLTSRCEPRADSVAISEFDSERGCFLPPTYVCFGQVPASGDGQQTCIAAPDGEVYAGHIPYGVELPPDWHSAGIFGVPNTLSEAEHRACGDLWQQARNAAAAFPDDELPTMAFGQLMSLGPACEPTDWSQLDD